MIDWNCIEAKNWGLEQFENIETQQKEAWSQVEAGHPGLLLAGEFFKVVTVGVRSNPDHILSPEIKSVRTDRGGATTLHSPGQLIIYPVVNLKKNKVGVKQFITDILEISRLTLLHFGVQTRVDLNQVGLWTDSGKIGFCGIRIKNGITQHGIALNLNNDLKLFEQITSCGLKSGQYDKLENHNQVSVKEFLNVWCEIAKDLSSHSKFLPSFP
jgi:lipoate-protein ligase B